MVGCSLEKGSVYHSPLIKERWDLASNLSSNIAWLAFIGHRRLWAGAAGTVQKHFIIQDLLYSHQGKRKVASGDLWCGEWGIPSILFTGK